MKAIAALALLATGAVAKNAPSQGTSTCSAFTCPSGWTPMFDAGFAACNGPCQTSDCCVRVTNNRPNPPVVSVPTTPKQTCVPLRTGNGGSRCVIKTGLSADRTTTSLGVGQCNDSRVVKFCGCTTSTSDNLCLASKGNSGRNGNPLVLRRCSNNPGRGESWKYLSNGSDFYLRNGFDKYINLDSSANTLIQSNNRGFFFLQQPCRARLENHHTTTTTRPTVTVTVTSTPQPTAPARPTNCAAFTCPAGWNRVLDAGFIVCDGPCQTSQCCTRNIPSPPTTCAAYSCPEGWTKMFDSGFAACNGPCRISDCCERD